MSKELGRKIGIKFTEDLVGDVSGMTPAPTVWEMLSPVGTVTYSSQYSSTYAANKVFDNNTGTYWRTASSVPQWVKIQFANPTWINGFRWYVNSYRPGSFTLEGSNDDVNWSILIDTVSENSTGWKEFYFAETQYKYFRWTINSVYSSRMYLYEIELSVGSGNEKAFNVTGQEYQYVNGVDNNGPIIDKVYDVDSIEKHPSIDKAILLSIKDYEEFNSVVGDLSISYDATKGNLSGRGGRVENFNISFLPTDLIPTPNPGIAEKLSIVPTEITASLKQVEYLNALNDRDKITVAPGTITASLQEAEIVNP